MIVEIFVFADNVDVKPVCNSSSLVYQSEPTYGMRIFD